MDSTEALLSTPIRGVANHSTQLLSNLVRLDRGTTASVVTHYNVQPMYDVFANVQDRDLGSVAREVDRVLAEFRPKLPRGSFFETRGQVETMRSSFIGLALGLVFAILLVYFVMVVNFQSWLDPFIILMALPGALAGILLMLFLTQTTLNVPSLMGAIMSIGVATANSILLVNFANDLRRAGEDAHGGARGWFYAPAAGCHDGAGHDRRHGAHGAGMGEGGEQNAPLGRAVIGGLLMATFATLFFVPVVYSVLRSKAPKDFDELEVADL